MMFWLKLWVHKKAEGVSVELAVLLQASYFHTVKRSKQGGNQNEEISKGDESLHLWVKELEAHIQMTHSTPTSGCGSCSKPRLAYKIESKKKPEDDKKVKGIKFQETLKARWRQRRLKKKKQGEDGCDLSEWSRWEYQEWDKKRTNFKGN